MREVEESQTAEASKGKEADKQTDLGEVQGDLRGQRVPPGCRAIGL